MFNFKLPGWRKSGASAPDDVAARSRREADANAGAERVQRRLSDTFASLENPVAPEPAKPVEPVAATLPPRQFAVPHEPTDTAALDEAQRRALEQRQAAEAMVREAQQLEQRIAAEATAALCETEQRAIQEGRRAAARALAVEQHAAAQAATLQERLDRMIVERKGHEVHADEVRVTERAAQAEVDARQAALEAALKTAAAAAIAVTEVDRVVVAYAKREDLLHKEIDQLTARATEQRDVREVAETYAREAEERLSQFGNVDNQRMSIEEIRAIEAHLTEQLEAVHRVTHPLADVPGETTAIAAAATASSTATTAPQATSAGENGSGAAIPHVA